ncbi:hypothetical protein [Loigolactobacillus binensis]|uniref:Uncharacterized protein n=1 Tax=Loigolactobacillus binensis TaxID=2559922 RepID=A0ABW3E847_9LACO|nr:hypothetical protein [Loigolactobacillus binensis]
MIIGGYSSAAALEHTGSPWAVPANLIAILGLLGGSGLIVGWKNAPQYEIESKLKLTSLKHTQKLI